MQTLYTRNFNQWNKRSIPFVDETSAGTVLEESSRKPKPKLSLLSSYPTREN